MGEPRTLRIDDPEDEQWIDEHIPRGEFNMWINNLIRLGVRDEIMDHITEEANEKTNRRISLFSMTMFLFIGFIFICYALAPYQIIIQSLLSSMFFITGVLIFIYVYINRKGHKELI
jgi:hypothetical protein